MERGEGCENIGPRGEDEEKGGAIFVGRRTACINYKLVLAQAVPNCWWILPLEMLADSVLIIKIADNTKD
jgi:hypothetical protein